MSKQSDNEEEEPHFSQKPFTQVPATERARRDNNSDPNGAIANIQDHLQKHSGRPNQ